jgi:hypothetical protein
VSNAAPPLLMGLDISKTRTGVAWGCVGDVPKFMSIVGSDMDDQAAMKKLGSWLIERTKMDRFDGVAIEAQMRMIPGDYDHEKKKVIPKGNPMTLLTLAKMVGVAEFVLGMKSVFTRTPAVSTVRKAFIGHGRLSKGEAERATRMMCAELGWAPSNHDEADAGAVWFWMGLQLKPHACQIITPMQQQRIISLATNKTSAGGLHGPAG